MENRLFERKEDCCGCGACQQICPVQCIRFGSDEEGFLYPSADEKHCIHCGKCQSVCPLRQEKYDSGKSPEAFAAKSLDERIRTGSSSGGLFPLLAGQILRGGGCVYGAAFDSEFGVHHVRVEKMEELGRLQGSKYLQSRMETSYADARNDLELGKKVLFSGTACQLAGLRGFLGKEYSGLYTVDVLCHGVPSPKVWREYVSLREREYRSRLKRVCFRDKETGWNHYSVVMEFENGSICRNVYMDDPYMRLFLENTILRPSCHTCRFKGLGRALDLTLGDAWGIDAFHPELDDDMGVSVVLVHTEKGRGLLKGLLNELAFVADEPDRLLPPDSDSRRILPPGKMREAFWNDCGKKSVESAIRRYSRKGFYRRVKEGLWVTVRGLTGREW